MQRLINWSVHNPRRVLLATAALALAGWGALETTTVDAVPDVSENQVVVLTEWHGRSPQDVERHVTHPLSALFVGLEGVRFVRAMSETGMSMLYISCDESVDSELARARILRRLADADLVLPPGLRPRLGPDATPLGQIYWYTLDAQNIDLGTLRALHDTAIRPVLQAIEGVAEVATAGGFEPEYQVTIVPERLAQFGVSLQDLRAAIERSNADVAGGIIERGGIELAVRGTGALQTREDLENIVIAMRGGTPLLVRHVAEVDRGPQPRRGVLADERGERVGGVVTMRRSENPREVIGRVNAALIALHPSLPPGVRIVPFYDRTQLIDETMDTLGDALVQEISIVVAVIFIFMFSARLSMIVALTLPLGVLVAFLVMRLVGVQANLMSLAGIVIAIGTMDDMAIVMSENIFAHLARPEDGRSRIERITQAAREVAPAIATATAAMIVSFLPIFFLGAQAGKLFVPLAWTKTLCVAAALFLAVVLVPVLCHLWLPKSTRWKVDEVPVSRFIYRHYAPALLWVLGHKRRFVMVIGAITALGFLHFAGARPLLTPFRALARALGGSLDRVEPFYTIERWFPPIGEAFMPPFDEGSLLYMPSLLPQASLDQTVEVMVRLNQAIRSVPEVAQVMGKAGRASTALDPAPVSMIETLINLKPKHEWRDGVTREELLAELRRKTEAPGVTPSWLAPIAARVVMLQSDLRAPMAIRLSGVPLNQDGTALDDVSTHAALEQLAVELGQIVSRVPGAADVQALRGAGKVYLELAFDQLRGARFGVNAADVFDSLDVALGDHEVTRVFEGRQRVPVRIRIARELRDDAGELARLVVPTPWTAGPAPAEQLGGHSMSVAPARLGRGTQVPLAWLADVREVSGPASIRTENGEPVGYVMFNAADGDEERVMQGALAAVEAWRTARLSARDPVPAGIRIEPAGRYLNKLHTDRRLAVIIPIVVLINFLLLYFAFRSLELSLAILAAIPVCFAGGSLGIGLFSWAAESPVHLTTAVWVGFVALFGIAIDDGAVMATYLAQRFKDWTPASVEEIRQGVLDAGLRRIRPCLMTTLTTMASLLPVLWSTGRGSDLLQPMALPLMGGLAISLITLFTVPAFFSWTQERKLSRGAR